MFLERKKNLGNGIGIKVLTTNKPGSPAYTTSEFVVCWDGEGSLEQLHTHTHKKKSTKNQLALPHLQQSKLIHSQLMGRETKLFKENM